MVIKMDNLKTGEVISKRRKELGLTQNQLAKSLNISFQAVSKWENGIHILTLKCGQSWRQPWANGGCPAGV